jgi:hypothetical protein
MDWLLAKVGLQRIPKSKSRLQIPGLFTQFGKIANDVAARGEAIEAARVAEARLVGTVTDGPISQYGPLRPHDRTYVFNDTHPDRIVDEMRRRDAQQG